MVGVEVRPAFEGYGRLVDALDASGLLCSGDKKQWRWWVVHGRGGDTDEVGGPRICGVSPSGPWKNSGDRGWLSEADVSDGLWWMRRG